MSTPNGPVCMCNDGYVLKNTDNKKKECVKLSNYPIPNACGIDEFQCVKSKQCISKKYTCDGDNDCGDGSDEDTVIGPCCKNFFFQISIWSIKYVYLLSQPYLCSRKLQM